MAAILAFLGAIMAPPVLTPAALGALAAATILAPLPAAAALLSDRDLALYRAAFAALDAGQWDEAQRTAGHAKETLPAKAITAIVLGQPTSGATFPEIAAFIDANPQWPGLLPLRKQAEMVLTPTTDTATVVAWFDRFPPVTHRGIMRDADALITAGQQAKAAELVRDHWINASLSASDEAEFRSHFDDLLRQRDHVARLDRLLWDGDLDGARRVLSLAPPGYRELAQARLGLAADQNDVDGLLTAVPIALRGDPGLRFERLRWRRRRDEDAGAIAILNNPPAQLGRPAAWWGERQILIRRVMAHRQYSLAYRLAVNHGQSDAKTLWQGEFLSGWLALRFLNRPQDALPHFQRLYDSVITPASRARGAYWLARSYENLNRADDAHHWYQIAAQVPTNYYGQLALENLGLALADALPAEPTITPAAAAAFEQNELVRLVRLLREIDNTGDREILFLRRIGMDAKTPAQLALAVRLAEEIGRRDLAVSIGKNGVQDDIAFVGGAYPTIKAPGKAPGAEPESALVDGLIRQESVFNKNAVSPAGALGLMQLMPSTAEHVARSVGVPFVEHRLISDGAYNVRLGAAFLQTLLDRFGGNYELATAAYNAGPGRVADWLHTFGDPRSGDSSAMIDWIESIPVAETRNYVQRVMENMKVYRGRGAKPAPATVDLVSSQLPAPTP
ncbi:MAG: lytic transglycosylase domain-containing protein [Azospirillaceae bacterium]|nr:lytic transglycosylase domain-containing protein [Azospirillaceae bacterium]